MSIKQYFKNLNIVEMRHFPTRTATTFCAVVTIFHMYRVGQRKACCLMERSMKTRSLISKIGVFQYTMSQLHCVHTAILVYAG